MNKLGNKGILITTTKLSLHTSELRIKATVFKSERLMISKMLVTPGNLTKRCCKENHELQRVSKKATWSTQQSRIEA